LITSTNYNSSSSVNWNDAPQAAHKSDSTNDTAVAIHATPSHPSDDKSSFVTTIPEHPTSNGEAPCVSDVSLFKASNNVKPAGVKTSVAVEAAGGWGDAPGPAPWEWQAMPFDYMGILEEQRRTVFYEFRERDGKPEWVVPDYSGIQAYRIKLTIDPLPSEKINEIEAEGDAKGDQDKVSKREKKSKEKHGSSDVVKRIRAAKGKSTKAPSSSSTKQGSFHFLISF